MSQEVRGQASPRGSWPAGPERASDEIPAATGRLFLYLPSHRCHGVPEGDVTYLPFISFSTCMIDYPLHPLCGSFPHWGTRRVLPIESFGTGIFRQSALYVPCSDSLPARSARRPSGQGAGFLQHSRAFQSSLCKIPIKKYAASAAYLPAPRTPKSRNCAKRGMPR